MTTRFDNFCKKIKEVIQFLNGKKVLKVGMGKKIGELVELASDAETVFTDVYDYLVIVNKLDKEWAEFMDTLKNSTDQFDIDIYNDYVKWYNNVYQVKQNVATQGTITQPATSTAKTTTTPVTGGSQVGVSWSTLADNAIANPKIKVEIVDGPMSKLNDANKQQAVDIAIIMCCNGPEGLGKTKYKFLKDAGYTNSLWRAFCLMVINLPGVLDKIKKEFPNCRMIQSYQTPWPLCHDKLQKSQQDNEEAMKKQIDLMAKLKEARKP
jgi:hypothetical protein